MRVRITVPLAPAEMRALAKMALDACRHPREHARYLIRGEAVRLGLLAAAEAVDIPVKGQEEAQDEELRG